jgi:hypothetical protein
MANTVSDYFTDEDLESQLMLQFEYEEMHTMDFRTVFSQIEDMGEFLQLRLRNRVFKIDKITGGVNEVEE